MEMAQRGDVFSLMFRLRGGLARDQYGMQHEGLFSRAISGTESVALPVRGNDGPLEIIGRLQSKP
jgi:hypothetical protein